MGGIWVYMSKYSRYLFKRINMFSIVVRDKNLDWMYYRFFLCNFFRILFIIDGFSVCIRNVSVF